MKSVWITRKSVSRVWKEYSKLISVLCSWKNASRLSYFRRVYQQRKDCFEKLSEECEKEWKNAIDELDGKCCGLWLQKYCKKPFNLIDIFWCDITYVDVNVGWLLKVKYLDKYEKIQSKIKRKRSRNMSTSFLLKKMVLERLDKYLPFFKFKYDFNAFYYCKYPDFENLYTLLAMNKGSSFVRSSSSSQASQDESAACGFCPACKERERDN